MGADRDSIPTPNDLHASDVFGWPLMIEMLKRIDLSGAYWLRLGVLQEIKWTANALVERDSTGELVDRLRRLVEILAHLPWKEIE